MLLVLLIIRDRCNQRIDVFAASKEVPLTQVPGSSGVVLAQDDEILTRDIDSVMVRVGK